MKAARLHPIIRELRALIREEEGLATSLIHASFHAEDPEEAIWLRRVAKECVEHARTLRRHLEGRLGPVPGARANLRPHHGDGRQEALEWAWAVARRLRRDYAWCTHQAVDRYLRMLLASLAETHARLAREIGDLVIGDTSFLRDEEHAPILDLVRRGRGRRLPKLASVRRGA
ncbi:MAG: hypothetical protein ACYTDY_08795 [Planctomycetota bacterium]|jgi:hypothetical protein